MLTATVTEEDIDRIPADVLRVPRGEVAAFWRAVEAMERTESNGWYRAGLLTTLRWLAGKVIPNPLPANPNHVRLPRAPVTDRVNMTVLPEQVEAEATAAGVLL